MPRTYTVRGLTDDEYDAMRVAAALAKKSMNAWIVQLIRAALPDNTEAPMTTANARDAEAQASLDTRGTEHDA